MLLIALTELRLLAGHFGIEGMIKKDPDVILTVREATRAVGQTEMDWWTTQSELIAELVELVRQRIGPVASFKAAMVVKRLPKTRSGKIVRGTVKKIADGVPWTAPATIDDATSLEEISTELSAIGYCSP